MSRVYASEARSSGIQRVTTGFRFAGSKLEIRENRINDFTLMGSGPMPPDLVGDALDERAPLADSEAVLLVDDHDGEIVEAHLLLDQRMRADDEEGVAGRYELPDGGVLARAQRARQQRDPET